MQIAAFYLSFIVVLFCAHSSAAADHSDLAEFDNLRTLSEVDGVERLVLGDANGRVHIFEGGAGTFSEVWVSEYMEGAIGGVFVVDVNDDGLNEIVVFTDQGRIYYIDSKDYRVIWSNPPGEYEHITSQAVYNIDDDPQPELLFCADGHLIVYDGRDQYEQWRSDQSNLTAREILIGDVDGDGEKELVLNDGYVFDARFFDLEWQSPESFGERLGLLDIDEDGIPELIGEFQGRYLRIFDIDLRREKSLAR
jgi:outer membrane protein assembly factor BamB